MVGETNTEIEPICCADLDLGECCCCPNDEGDQELGSYANEYGRWQTYAYTCCRHIEDIKTEILARYGVRVY